jgi:intracellular septation protein A
MPFDWSILLLGAFPLVVFVVVDSFSNMRYAIIGALCAAALELGYGLYRFGEIDEFSTLSVGLILLFGGLSIKFDNPLYFKFKPVILSSVFAATFLITYALSKPLLLMAMDRYADVLPAQMQAVLTQPQIRQVFERASLYLGFGFIVHAGAVAWVALHRSNWWWLLTRTVGAYLMLFIVALLATL